MKKHMVFLKLDGVRGESNFLRHLGEIEVIHFEFGMEHPPNGGFGIINPRKPQLTDLHVSKLFDSTSQVLLDAFLKQREISKGLLTWEELSESGSLLRSVIWTLKSVLVSSVRTNDDDVELVSLNIERLEGKIS